MKRDFKFETLNGESLSNVKGGSEATKHTHCHSQRIMRVEVMVANLRQGCSSIEDSLIVK